MAVGVHPAAGFGEVTVTGAPRYGLNADQFGGFFRTPTAAFQVHVGVPDPAALVAGFRAVRNRLPVLRALAAGSPFWHGRDSSLATSRGAVLRSYPRTGVPPSFGSYEEYQALTEELLAAAEVPDYTFVWWDVRPHPLLGTVEVRGMDAQCSLEHAAGLVALVQGLVRRAAESPAEPDIPSTVLDESDFRAVRFGLDARVVDVDGRMRPLRELAAELVRDAQEALGSGGTAAPLDDLAQRLQGEPEYERQRRLHAGGGMPALLDDLRQRTCGEPAPVAPEPRRPL
jgi:carboxylate-amine ligase